MNPARRENCGIPLVWGSRACGDLHLQASPVSPSCLGAEASALRFAVEPLAVPKISATGHPSECNSVSNGASCWTSLLRLNAGELADKETVINGWCWSGGSRLVDRSVFRPRRHRESAANARKRNGLNRDERESCCSEGRERCCFADRESRCDSSGKTPSRRVPPRRALGRVNAGAAAERLAHAGAIGARAAGAPGT